MTSIQVADAVSLLRRAGLAPTRRRITLTALLFAGPTVPNSADELRERAIDAGLCLSTDGAVEALAELRRMGLMPDFLTQRPEVEGGLHRSARLLQAMGNPHRLAILRELSKGERRVGELLTVVGIQPSALSQHLARLRSDGLIRARRSARNIFYAIADADVGTVLRSLGH